MSYDLAELLDQLQIECHVALHLTEGFAPIFETPGRPFDPSLCSVQLSPVEGPPLTHEDLHILMETMKWTSSAGYRGLGEFHYHCSNLDLDALLFVTNHQHSYRDADAMLASQPIVLLMLGYYSERIYPVAVHNGIGNPKGVKRDFAALERRRMQAVKPFEQGISKADVGRRCGGSKQSAGRGHAAWEAGGRTRSPPDAPVAKYVSKRWTASNWRPTCKADRRESLATPPPSGPCRAWWR
jgi:hypothetical protein